MSLGTGALKVGREPECLRHSKEVSMATLRAGTTQNTQLSKVLGERRNPQTGGGQGTSELPQQLQALWNQKGEPNPGVRHTSLVSRIHHWLSSCGEGDEPIISVSGKGTPGPRLVSLCITGGHYLTTVLETELGDQEHHYEQRPLLHLCGNCGWKSFQISQQRRRFDEANLWVAHEIEDDHLEAWKEDLEHSPEQRDKPS